MRNLPALFWFPFSVDEMLANCDSLQPSCCSIPPEFQEELQLCIFRKVSCNKGFSHPINTLRCSVGVCEYPFGGPLFHPLTVNVCRMSGTELIQTSVIQLQRASLSITYCGVQSVCALLWCLESSCP